MSNALSCHSTKACASASDSAFCPEEELPDRSTVEVGHREDLRGLPGDRAAHLSLAIERHDGLTHVIEEIAEVLRRRREPALTIADLLAHAIERGRELAELVVRAHVDARREVASADTPCRVRQAAQRVHDLRP